MKAYLYLGVALALAALLSFSHYRVYRAGDNHARTEWKLSAAAANAEARRLEQQRQRRADEAQQLAAGRSRVLAADARNARSLTGGLREELDATRLHAAKSSDAAAKSVATLSSVFESCTRANLDLAAAAQGHANDSLMYQESWPK